MPPPDLRALLEQARDLNAQAIEAQPSRIAFALGSELGAIAVWLFIRSRQSEPRPLELLVTPENAPRVVQLALDLGARQAAARCPPPSGRSDAPAHWTVRVIF